MVDVGTTDLDSQKAKSVPKPQIVRTNMARRNCGKTSMETSPVMAMAVAAGPVLVALE